jgi:hypothetical protein
MSNYFPPEFSELELFGSRALPTESERAQLRVSRPYEETRALYDLVLPRVDSILEYVGQFDPDDLPADAERLFWLALAFADVAASVEWWDAKNPPDLSEPFDVKIYQ